MRSALLVLMIAAGPIAAQAPATEPRKPLNLNLDDAMRSQPVIQFGPADKKDAPAGGLPSLGSDARKIEAAPAGSSESRRPFPKDSEMQNR